MKTTQIGPPNPLAECAVAKARIENRRAAAERELEKLSQRCTLPLDASEKELHDKLKGKIEGYAEALEDIDASFSNFES